MAVARGGRPWRCGTLPTCCSPPPAFPTGTGFRCPSPPAEQPPQRTPRARGARGVSRSRGPTVTPPRQETEMSATRTPAPADPDADGRIAELRGEIDACDAELIRLVQHRLAVSQEIGELRRATGGTRLSLSREKQVLARFQEALGADGAALGMLLLRQGRGRL
ncbi:chorismate mutase [Geodermatophilus sp. SYSU D00710]